MPSDGCAVHPGCVWGGAPLGYAAAVVLLPLLLACSGGPDASAPSTGAPAHAATRPPDVLLVVLDTMRADALGAYGNPRPTSPQFDAIAEAGVRFADVTAEGSWTWPSHATLFTGQPPWVHGAHFAPPAEGGMQVGPDPFHAAAMREDLPTLAERFGEAGYRTVSISANRLIAHDFGLARGFADASNPGDDAGVVAAARAALAVQDDRPLLLFANLYGAHAPFDVQPVGWLEGRPELAPATAPDWLRPFLVAGGRRVNLFIAAPGSTRLGLFAYMRGELPIPPSGQRLLRDVYEGEVAFVDFQLHQLITAWQQARGPGQVVAVTSDHGELFGEHLAMEHGRFVYPELTHVPLVVSAPGRLPAGKVVDTPVQLSQVADTIAALAGLHDGPSLLDVAAGGPGPGFIRAASWRDHFWAEQVGPRVDQGWRLCRDGDELVIFGELAGLEYYRLGADGPSDDLAASEPDRAEALRSDPRCSFPEVAPTGSVSASPDAIRHLQALGYVDPDAAVPGGETAPRPPD